MNFLLLADPSIRDNFESMIERVSEKHRALSVKDEQYPVVGETLLEAVKDVLGDAATDEVIEAWEKAYKAIADIFMDREAKLYRQTEQQAGGWIGIRSFYVYQKVRESDVITSFYLKPEDGKPIASFKPGRITKIIVLYIFNPSLQLQGAIVV